MEEVQTIQNSAPTAPDINVDSFTASTNGSVSDGSVSDVPFDITDSGRSEVSSESASVSEPAEAVGSGQVQEPAVNKAEITKKLKFWHARWDKLVSQTNWEKGELILQWRNDLIAVGVPATVYSDEVWSKMVGNVSAQHVGRLRRVFEQFGSLQQSLPTLFWSHFQAALDWDDAQKWLEDAAANNWSISQMRIKRWEALGCPPDKKPREAEIKKATADLDEDANPLYDELIDSKNKVDSSEAEVRNFNETFGSDYGPGETGPDFGDESGANVPFDPDKNGADEGKSLFAPPKEQSETVRPFEDIPDLPEDLLNAFDALKIAIISHKLSGWRDISCDDILSALNAMKQLALAPSD